MAPDRTSTALDELRPEDRALVELFVVRQLGDIEIAELLRVEVTRVTDRRQRAFDRFAAAAGAGSAPERAELIRSLRERGESSRRERAPGPELAGGAGDAYVAPEAAARKRGGWAPALVVIAVALGAIVALALAGGDDDESDRGAGKPRRAFVAQTAAMRPPAGGPALGAARLHPRGEQTRLSVDVRALPDPGSDRYSLWVYNSVSDARRLASFPKGRFQADLPLPERYDRYRHVDVSREPEDGNPAHGGQSVLRVALVQLRKPVRLTR